MTRPTAVEWADNCWKYWTEFHSGEDALRMSLENVDTEEIETYKPDWWLRAVRGRLYWLSTGGKPGIHPTPKR